MYLWRLALAIVGLAAAGACCTTAPPVPPPPPRAGCQADTLLATGTITLQGGPGQCTPKVDRAKLCVQRGGAVRWLVVNECGELEGSTAEPALAVKLSKDNSEVKWFLETCSASLVRVPRGSPLESDVLWKSNVILCHVPNKRDYEGLYKYSLKGKINELDPHLEVTPPGP